MKVEYRVHFKKSIFWIYCRHNKQSRKIKHWFSAAKNSLIRIIRCFLFFKVDSLNNKVGTNGILSSIIKASWRVLQFLLCDESIKRHGQFHFDFNSCFLCSYRWYFHSCTKSNLFVMISQTYQANNFQFIFIKTWVKFWEFTNKVVILVVGEHNKQFAHLIIRS